MSFSRTLTRQCTRRSRPFGVPCLTCAGPDRVHGPETGNGPGKLEVRCRTLHVAYTCEISCFHSVTPTQKQRPLAVALERALQRKLGTVPSPTLVNKAISKLAPDGADPSPFVQHAIRVQEQLARMHAQLDRKSTRLNSSHQCLSRMPSSA